MGRMIFMKGAERFFRDLEELNDQAKLCKILLEKFNIEDGTTECEIPDDEIEYFKNAFHKLNVRFNYLGGLKISVYKNRSKHG